MGSVNNLTHEHSEHNECMVATSSSVCLSRYSRNVKPAENRAYIPASLLSGGDTEVRDRKRLLLMAIVGCDAPS